MVMPGEYIEFTASPYPIGSNRNFVGLSYVDGGFLQTSINYSWYLYPDGGNHIVENGSIPYSNYTPYVPGVTKFRIARTGGNIVYYKNGVVIRTVAETNPNLPMVIDITIWNTNTADPTIVYQLKVGKLTQVMATYGSGDYLPYTHADYRFGYNGMEKDPEQKGEGNSYTTEFRQYDPRLGRWLSLDPLMMMFPDMSPYCAFDNNPVVFTDPYGLSATNPDAGEWNFTRAPESEAEVGGEGRMYKPDKGPGSGVYTIQENDNFWSLENKWGMEHGTLGRLNENIDPNKLQIGQKIYTDAVIKNDTEQFLGELYLALGDYIIEEAYKDLNRQAVEENYLKSMQSFERLRGHYEKGRPLQEVLDKAEYAEYVIPLLGIRKAAVKTIAKRLTKTAAKKAVSSGAKLTSAQLGKIIGWGEGQSIEAVRQTMNVTKNLTKSQVQSWAKQGLTKSWVEDQLRKYTRALSAGGDKLKNNQLEHRKELMEKMLELWD